MNIVSIRLHLVLHGSDLLIPYLTELDQNSTKEFHLVLFGCQKCMHSIFHAICAKKPPHL